MPLLIVPPTINKFYVVDIAPGRSLVEYLLGEGHQVYTISWRNPDVRHARWGFDTYGGGDRQRYRRRARGQADVPGVALLGAVRGRRVVLDGAGTPCRCRRAGRWLAAAFSVSVLTRRRRG